jgi:hypothetical protein
MAVVQDFTVSADLLRWVDRGDLTEVVPGLRFRTPAHFYEDTLVVFVNGSRVERSNFDGFFIVDDETFEMNQAYLFPEFRITAGYVQKGI